MARPPRKSGGSQDGPSRGNRTGTGTRTGTRTGETRSDGARSDGKRSFARGPRNDARKEGGQRQTFQGPNVQGKPRAAAKPRPAPPAAPPTPKDPTMPVREGERIAKLLARAGVASRREAERMIAEGRVKLGEDVIDAPSTVLTSLQGVTVDGKPVKAPEATRLFVFHKPSGLITAERDPAGRPTIYNALVNALPPGTGRVMPVGRLDFNTEGLLLLTNDGEFKRQLELPATGVPRTYRARAFGPVTQAQLEELIEGVEIEGIRYGKINANMERSAGHNKWIEMTLTEGKNREVRRVLEHLGLEVSRLIRTAYGPFVLGDLPKGAVGEVSPRDLENFRRTLPGGKK